MREFAIGFLFGLLILLVLAAMMVAQMVR